MSVRSTIATAIGALVVVGGLAVPVQATSAPAAAAASTRTPSSCPAPGQGNHSVSSPNGLDRNVNVYVGGDFFDNASAELEGQLVVNGSARFSGSGTYNVGSVGVGSGLTPPARSTMLRIGGDAVVEDGIRLDVGALGLGSDAAIGGALTAKRLEFNGGSAAFGIGRAAALGSFANWDADQHAFLRSVADRTLAGGTPGAAEEAWGMLTFTGDGSSERQIFTVDAAKLAGKPLSLDFRNLAPGAVAVIKVTGTTVDLGNVQGIFVNGSPLTGTEQAFGALATHTMWVFPEATTATIGRSTQFPGSIVVPTPGSSTLITAAGMNGRVWVAGDLEQRAAGGEIHNYPFVGEDDMDCGDPVDPDGGSNGGADAGSTGSADAGSGANADAGTDSGASAKSGANADANASSSTDDAGSSSDSDGVHTVDTGANAASTTGSDASASADAGASAASGASSDTGASAEADNRAGSDSNANRVADALSAAAADGATGTGTEATAAASSANASDAGADGARVDANSGAASTDSGASANGAHANANANANAGADTGTEAGAEHRANARTGADTNTGADANTGTRGGLATTGATDGPLVAFVAAGLLLLAGGALLGRRRRA